MRVLFTSIRESGHFLPLVPFIHACLRRGHEVAVSTPLDFADRVAETGARFFPLGHPGDAALAPVWARMRESSPDEMKNVAVSELFAGALAGAAVPTLIETIENWRPGVVIREAQEYGAVIAAEKCSIPHARVAISLSGPELEFSRVAVPSLDRHRSRFGIERPDPSGECLIGEPVLTLLAPTFDGGGVQPGNIKRFRTPIADPAPLPDWWPGNRDPLVYLTLGTVTGVMDSARGAYRVVLDAVRGVRARVLLTIGSKTSMDELGEVPANVHVERFVPQDDVLPHVQALLCHGGTGTVMGALAAGIPQVIFPLFADQPQNAERIHAIGAGIAVPLRTTSSADIGQALERVLGEPSFRTVAQRIATEIAALPLVDEAPGEIERLSKT